MKTRRNSVENVDKKSLTVQSDNFNKQSKTRERNGSVGLSKISFARKKLLNAIFHQSYAELAEIAQILKLNNHPFSIITRFLLEKHLTESNVLDIMAAAKLLELEGPQETMLLLLNVVQYNYKTLKPIKRFDKWFIEPKIH